MGDSNWRNTHFLNAYRDFETLTLKYITLFFNHHIIE